MTKDQIRTLIFTEVEVSDDGKKWWTCELLGYDEDFDTPFIIHGASCKFMRPIQPKKKRLLTVKELWGETLIRKNGDMVMVTETYTNNCGESLIIGMGGTKFTVDYLHYQKGWKLAGPDLCYETATSLEIAER